MMGYHLATTGYADAPGPLVHRRDRRHRQVRRSGDRDAVKAALASIAVTDAQVNTLTKSGDAASERYTIATQTRFRERHVAALGRARRPSAGSIARQSAISSVGPSLSREYLINAIKALVIAIAIQFLYIAFRFGWNYIFGLVTSSRWSATRR